MSAHPQFAEWCTEVQTLAEIKRISVNAFGRVRTFLGAEHANARRALNTPIQGSASDVVRDDMIDIDQAFLDAGLDSEYLTEDFGARIVLNVHDEILFMVRDDKVAEAWPIIKRIMSRERLVNGYKFNIPIDAEIGTHWGEMGALDENDFEHAGKSKH